MKIIALVIAGACWVTAVVLLIQSEYPAEKKAEVKPVQCVIYMKASSGVPFKLQAIGTVVE